MSNNLIQIKLRALPQKEVAGIDELVTELWFWVEKLIRSTVKSKPSQQVTTAYLDEAIEDLLALSNEKELVIHFANPGGVCSMSAIAAQHWTELALLLLKDQLAPVAEELGYGLSISGGGLKNWCRTDPPNP